MTTFIEMYGFYLKGYPNIQLSDKLTKEQKIVLSVLLFRCKHPNVRVGISFKELAQQCNLTVETVKNSLEGLKSLDVITFNEITDTYNIECNIPKEYRDKLFRDTILAVNNKITDNIPASHNMKMLHSKETTNNQNEDVSKQIIEIQNDIESLNERFNKVNNKLDNIITILNNQHNLTNK